MPLQPGPQYESFKHMLKWTFRKRTQAFQEESVYRTAKLALNSVRAKIPQKDEYKKYSESLKLMRIAGTTAGSFGYAIYAQAGTSKKSGLDPDKTLVYVQPKRAAKPASKRFQVLVEHGPWTVDLLPFVPKNAEGSLVYRKVSERDVKFATRRLLKAKSKWRSALKQAGVSTQSLDTKIQKRSMQATEDLQYTALRLERGQPGEQASPHWGPGLRAAFGGLGGQQKDKDMQRSVADPDYRGWMSWRQKTDGTIPLRTVRQYSIADKLGFKP